MKRILVNGRLVASEIACPACAAVLDAEGVTPGESVSCPQCHQTFPALFAGNGKPAAPAPSPPPPAADLRPILARIEAHTAQSAQTLREIRNWFAALILFGAILALVANIRLLL